MAIPDFVIIGAAKSATTTFHSYCEQHPQICMCRIKEPNFFSSNYLFSKGLEWYESLYELSNDKQLCGEASTDYTKFPNFLQIPQRIFAVNPNAKLIYLLRDPIERAYSHYVHLHRTIPFAKATFESFLMRSNEILNTSDYNMQIKQYLEVFPRSSLFCIISEEFTQNPKPTLAKIASFLKIENTWNLTVNQGVHANNASEISSSMRQGYYTQQLKRVIPVWALANIIPPTIRSSLNFSSILGQFVGDSQDPCKRQGLRI